MRLWVASLHDWIYRTSRDSQGFLERPRCKIPYICILVVFLLLQSRNDPRLHEVVSGRSDTVCDSEHFQRLSDIESDIRDGVGCKLEQRIDDVATNNVQIQRRSDRL